MEKNKPKISVKDLMPKEAEKGSLTHNIIIVAIVIVLISSLYIIPKINQQKIENVSVQELTEIIKEKSEDEKVKVVVKPDDGTVDVITQDGKISRAIYRDTKKSFDDFMKDREIDLSNSNIDLEQKTTVQIGIDTVLTIGLVLLTIFAAYNIVKSINASGSRMSSFGESTAKLLVGKKTNVTFDEVAGIKEAKEELEEVVDFLKNPQKYFKLGARIPRGVLLVGAPGTGKTLLARAVAGEANVPFFHTSGAEFEEMLVGAGAARVRDMFKRARRLAPSIIFIDEIDAVAKKREVSLKSSYTEQTLNQILVEMDGFTRYDTVIVLAATNRPDILDPAILRPGRFDRKVVIDRPDAKGREEILKVHLKNKPVADDVNVEIIAKKTIGLAGADLENVANEAAIIAAKRGEKKIFMSDMEESILKVRYGRERRSKVPKKEELLNTAFHEAGHAIVSFFTEHADPVHKISIVARGLSAGMTMYLPDDDYSNFTIEQMKARIRIATGGRIAEEIMTGTFGTGASQDIEQVTEFATGMVKKYGMSEKLGFVKYGENLNEQWLGYSYETTSNYSQEYAKLIDMEIQKIIETEYKKAVEILTKNKNKIKELADLLVQKEVIEREEFEKFMKG